MKLNHLYGFVGYVVVSFEGVDLGLVWEQHGLA
jgi:hypothetical protein